MTLFYHSLIESLLTFSFICRVQSLEVKQKNILNKVVNVCSIMTGTAQETLQDLYNNQLHKKAENILSDCSHPLHQEFLFLPSGSLLRLPPAKTNRHKHSFTPSAVSLLNSRRSLVCVVFNLLLTFQHISFLLLCFTVAFLTYWFPFNSSSFLFGLYCCIYVLFFMCYVYFMYLTMHHQLPHWGQIK